MLDMLYDYIEEQEKYISIYYNSDKRYFEDDQGFIIYDIYKIISPNDFMLFMDLKDEMITTHKSLPNIYVEMYYIPY